MQKNTVKKHARLVLITPEIYLAISRVLDYLEPEERRDYETCKDYETHIYLSLLIIQSWLDDS